MGLWSKKSITQLMHESEGDGGPTLKRTLTGSNLVLLGIGAIIGAGIFVLTGSAAAQYAGPGIVISFVIAGFGCLFAGLCYAEFASMIPIAGSAYTYGYATLGEFVAWIIGWDLILEYLFAASTVAVGWSGYFTAFLSEIGITVPAAIAGAPLSVEGTHTLVRSQLCVDPASGGIAVDAVSRTPVRIEDCLAQGFEIGSGILNVGRKNGMELNPLRTTVSMSAGVKSVRCSSAAGTSPR
jgi:APA family basic amino acid/polyamine antiporter